MKTHTIPISQLKAQWDSASVWMAHESEMKRKAIERYCQKLDALPDGEKIVRISDDDAELMRRAW